MSIAELMNSAVAALQGGNPAWAEQIARKQLFAGSSERDSWLLLLAMTLQAQGRLSEAVDVYADLKHLHPGSGLHWGNLGTALRQAGRQAEAEAAYCQAIVLDPSNALHFVNVGLLLLDMGNPNSARNAFLQASEIDGDNVQARIHGALACFKCGDEHSARRLLTEREDWRYASQLQMEDRLTLSTALLLLGYSADAEKILLDTLPLVTRENVPLVETRLAHLYERLNRLDEAHRIASRLPDLAQVADAKLSTEIVAVHAKLARRNNEFDVAKAHMRRLAASKETNEQDEAAVMFAIAKICDRQGEIDEAMQALQDAHAAQLKYAMAGKGLTIDPDADPLQPLMPRMSAEQFARWPAGLRSGRNPQSSPIFIVGFPRSGTTLLEQMLDAIPGLRSMDERDFMRDIVNRFQNEGIDYPECLGELDAAKCDELRSMYWKSVARVVPLGRDERLVDKNPLNMLLLPLICRLFPESPIILALRHPCDVVLSCYMQHFGMPIFMDMCSSIARLARSYAHAMNVWIGHERVIGPNVLHLRHEHMLADFDGHARRIGEFLGIEDIRAMHSFDDHARRKGYIATPSYDQVIQPLNTAGVGRWRKYDAYFREALPILRPIIEHWGYELGSDPSDPAITVAVRQAD